MRRLAAGLVLTIALLLVADAQASIYDEVLHAYQANGSIPPCEFTSLQLSAALRGVDTYGQQYFADFTNAVQSTLAARASGACTPGLHLSTAGAAAGAPLRPGSLTASTAANVPAPMLLMAALGLLIAAAAAARALVRGFGWDPGWAVRWRHACSEASYRIGGGWGHIGDWWRSGP